MKELAIEDTAQYKDMMRMSHSVFQRMLSYIEQDITRKQVLGGNKVFPPKERLALTISHTQNCLASIHGDQGYVLIAHALAQQC